jgi:hypothetical protein
VGLDVEQLFLRRRDTIWECSIRGFFHNGIRIPSVVACSSISRSYLGGLDREHPFDLLRWRRRIYNYMKSQRRHLDLDHHGWDTHNRCHGHLNQLGMEPCGHGRRGTMAYGFGTQQRDRGHGYVQRPVRLDTGDNNDSLDAGELAVQL